MTSELSNGEKPIILYTERLKLRMADPASDADCQHIINFNNDPAAGKGGNSKVGLDTIPNVRKKHELLGPKAELCTLAPPPYGMCFLVYLPPTHPGGEDTLVGHIMLSFRPEMPYPDLGYGTFGPYQKQGYTSEAGRRAVQYWREVIGVREIWCGTLADNEQSQKCAERIGFVRAGTFNVVFGRPPDYEPIIVGAKGFVLPGMKWQNGLTIYPTVN